MDNHGVIVCKMKSISLKWAQLLSNETKRVGFVVEFSLLLL